MKQIPQTPNFLVLRTDFDNQNTWETIWERIRAPVQEGEGEPFYADVEAHEDVAYANLTPDDLLGLLPPDYTHSVIFVVDNTTIASADYPILVISLEEETRGVIFRAIPSQVQAIGNNLSLCNMDFLDFADSVGDDGIFRGFPE